MSLARAFAVSLSVLGWFGLLGGTGCIWLDDFDKFTVTDAGPVFDAGRDAGPDASREDAAADASDSEDASTACRDVDCSAMDSECTRGRCDPATGECAAVAVADGRACFDNNPCTEHDQCSSGRCAGEALDCSKLDDECSQGICDPETGGCTFGPNQMSRSCDDANPCTTGDRCDGEGRCLKAADAPDGASCTDYNACTGTSTEPDHCNGLGRCIEGAVVNAGATCDDDSECTRADRCDGMGTCTGDAVREGERCEGDCTSNTFCRAGVCRPEANAAPAYDPSCVFNLCGQASICRPEWESDHRVCHCGCGFSDADCNGCSARMCQTDESLDHVGVRWCDAEGKAVDNCPDSLKGDGHCDCGCQFDDPDCEGGSCCSATGKAGCDDKFVESCVCNHETNGDPKCCTDAWTDQCAQLAVGLGCAVCN